MRVILIVLLSLNLLLTIWCMAGYVGTRPQQYETRAELKQTQESGKGLTHEEIDRHVSRVGRQGRNWAIGALLSGMSAVLSLACVILSVSAKRAVWPSGVRPVQL